MADQRIELVGAWLHHATVDLDVGDLIASGQEHMLPAVLFHAQQAVEKSMKGFLVYHHQRFRKSHDLDALGELCVAIEPSLREPVNRVTGLGRFAVEPRYPEYGVTTTRGIAEAAIAAARQFFDEMCARMPDAPPAPPDI